MSWHTTATKLLPQARRTLAPMRVFIFFAVQATMPPMIARPPATSTKLRRPNLSETRPVIRREMALHIVHTTEKRLALGLGPAMLRALLAWGNRSDDAVFASPAKNGRSTRWTGGCQGSPDAPISRLMNVSTDAGTAKPKYDDTTVRDIEIMVPTNGTLVK